MSLKFRKFKNSDLKEFKLMVKALYKEDPGENPYNEKKTTTTFKFLPKHPDAGTIIIFEDSKKIAGYAILINFWSNEYGGNVLSVDEFYVKPVFRNKGIGTNFLYSLIQKKIVDNVAVQLEVVPENKRALSMYKKLGFKPAPYKHLIYG